jgi:hypothetical protein
MVKKHLQENPFTSGINHLLKLVAFTLWRRRIQADDQVTRLWSMFVCHFSVVRKNPQSRQGGKWVMSLTWECEGCCVSGSLFWPYKFQVLQKLKPKNQPRQKYFCTIKLKGLKEDNLFFGKKFFSMRLPFTYQGRRVKTIQLSGKHRIHTKLLNCVRWFKSECFLCCKQDKGSWAILFCWDYNYRSRVPQYAGALPWSTDGCKQCDLATRWDPSPLSQGCDIVPEPQIPRKDRLWWLHSVTNHITQSDTNWLFILGICER